LKKLSAIFIIPLMLLGALLSPSLAHAATGVISVNGGALITAVQTATSVSVPIQISGSNALNAFDIQVSADPTILSGASVSLTGSVLSNPSIVLECINGVLVAGTTCSSQDHAGVVHLAVTTIGSLTTAPTTGLLFAINYNVVGTTTGTPISFNTGCVQTSIPNGDCVTIANGSASAVPETDQGSSFANLIDFKMTPAFAKLSTPSGVAITDVINYVAQGGYTDIVSETCAATTGLTCTPASSSVDLTVAKTALDTFTISGTASGFVTVTATGQGLFTPSTPIKTHSVTIPVQIAPKGFSLAVSQSTVTISRGSSDSSTTIAAAGVSGFSGAVAFTSSSTSGITGTAPSATLTPDGSGYSIASSALTIAVASTVGTGLYTLTITGTSGTSTSSASISVVVPGEDFSISAVPAAITIVRGGSVASSLNLLSLGNFAGAVTFTTSITNQGTDSCCFTNNITPAYSPATVTLTAGGSASVAFFASTVGGASPVSSYTATGNYTATITATSGTTVHIIVIVFNVQDFSVGPAYCNGGNNIQTTPNGINYPVTVNTKCGSLTITDQPNILQPGNVGNQVLWVQTNAFGGLVTDGFNGTPAIAALNSQIDPRGIKVPQLASVLPAGFAAKMCLLPTFWANGTQVPYSYLQANGPWVTPGIGFYVAIGQPGLGNWGCKFDAGAFPNDHGIGELNDFYMTHFNRRHTHTLCQIFGPDFFFPGDPGCPYPTFNNPDFWGVTAMSVQGTLAGSYTFQVCGQIGVLRHCNTYGLNVVASAIVHQLVVKKSTSFSASLGTLPFKMGITNPDVNTVYAQVTITGVGSLGDSFTVTSATVTIAPNANANNIVLTVPLTSAMIGETFTFSFSIAESVDPNNLTGTSTLQTIQQTILITS
jgi:hypothetical protein